MPVADFTGQSKESALCTSCGLCCTGHLFSWVRLSANELDHAEALGLNVIRTDPRQRGFTQPCPVWDGICTVYSSPDYPQGCRKYRCKLLKQAIDDSVPLAESLAVVQQALAMIREIETDLPASSAISFRERLIARMEQGGAEEGFLSKAGALLAFFELHFGVNDFLEKPAEDAAAR